MKNFVRNNPLFAILITAVLAVGVLRAAEIPFYTLTPQVNDESSAIEQKMLKATLVQPGTDSVASAQGTAASPATVIPARYGRRGMTVRNLDASAIIYVGGSGVSDTTGYKLGPGESIPVDCAGTVMVYAPTGTPRFSYIETYTDLPVHSP